MSNHSTGTIVHSDHAPRSIAIVSAVHPFPVSSGKDVVLAGLVDYWSERLGAEHVHYLLIRPDGECRPSEFPVRLHRIPAASSARRFRSAVTRGLSRRTSLQEALLFDRALGLRIASVVDRLNVDLVLFDTVRLGQFERFLVPREGQQRMIYLDDLFSERYATMLEAMHDHPDLQIDALGQFRVFIPRPALSVASSHRLQKVLLRSEKHLIARAEVSAAQRFDRSFLINGEEVELLRERSGSARVHAMPPLLPVTARPRPLFDGQPDFLFVGQLSIPHNDDGIRWFLERGMGPLLDRLPGARLRIVGREAGPALVAAATRFGDRVRLEGYVNDLDALMAKSAALICPLRFGSGVKIKLVDALARGLPSVTTSIGGHGVVTDDQSGVLIEDRIDSYPQLLADLVDRDTNRRVSQQARAHFATRFSREAVTAEYDRAFGMPRVHSRSVA